MRQVRTAIGAALLVGFGYICGTAQVGSSIVTAQDQSDDPAAAKVLEAYRRLEDARDALQSAGKYEAVTEGLNSFLVLAGGGNAKEDLDSGRGVDPETFAALYAGRAIPDLQPLLGVNDLGQVTYNNEVVRMYSKSRLQKAFAERLKVVSLSK